ncbi:AraC family transcriptional regulator [Paenibacillus chartarius]|uniref:AraC family transcriptional regulator n=1 Tax=Paenibacillus chartarius TaxID=747481 RepID=A0ABV6DUG0_9BACL
MRKSFIIEKLKRSEQYDMKDNEIHEEYEMYYLVEGKRHYFINGTSYTVHPGDLVFIPSYALHKTSDPGVHHHERVLIQFHPSFLMGGSAADEHALSVFRQPYPLLHLDPSQQSVLEPLLELMIKEVQRREPDSRLMLQALLVQLLLTARRWGAEQSAKQLKETPLAKQKVTDIVHYLKEHYAEPLSLEQVANHFYMSPYYLCRMFKKSTGFHFTDYVHMIRIHESQRRLLTSKDSVLDIALQVGFKSLSHFQQVFKKYTKLTPRQYRKSTQA